MMGHNSTPYSLQEHHGPVGLIHIDAHADTHDTMLGEKIAHGTPFRRAVEDGCLDCKRVVQIGLRGSGYSSTDYDWGKDQVRTKPEAGASMIVVYLVLQFRNIQTAIITYVYIQITLFDFVHIQ